MNQWYSKKLSSTVSFRSAIKGLKDINLFPDVAAENLNEKKQTTVSIRCLRTRLDNSDWSCTGNLDTFGKTKLLRDAGVQHLITMDILAGTGVIRQIAIQTKCIWRDAGTSPISVSLSSKLVTMRLWFDSVMARIDAGKDTDEESFYAPAILAILSSVGMRPMAISMAHALKWVKEDSIHSVYQMITTLRKGKWLNCILVQVLEHRIRRHLSGTNTKEGWCSFRNICLHV